MGPANGTVPPSTPPPGQPGNGGPRPEAAPPRPSVPPRVEPGRPPLQSSGGGPGWGGGGPGGPVEGPPTDPVGTPPPPAATTQLIPPTLPPQPQGPLFSPSTLALAAVALLLVFVLVGWVLFQPSTFTQKLITFGVAAALMVWVVSVVDGSQRRSLDRLQRRMELQREVAIAQAQAAERGRVLDAFLGSFVVNVNGSIGDYPPYPNYELPNAPRGPMPSDGRSHAVRPPVRRPDPRDD